MYACPLAHYLLCCFAEGHCILADFCFTHFAYSLESLLYHAPLRLVPFPLCLLHSVIVCVYCFLVCISADSFHCYFVRFRSDPVFRSSAVHSIWVSAASATPARFSLLADLKHARALQTSTRGLPGCGRLEQKK